MTKEEILKLHTLSETDQKGFLVRCGILQDREFILHVVNKKCDCGKDVRFLNIPIKESLADCAFRIRDEAGHQRFMNAVHTILVELGITSWIHASLPIHWIQAALLVKLEAKGE